ncbi:putative ankyrin repeat domain containing protein [Phaeomoniella chlamydospora]|uniref:Putative ankyrin repeat domain containing protein n=1 Tax=Phaeomoniella chlamydospora TaxID=158046 RepID=A0A0G2EZM4_PHACM|nr:putative ankyrin repeat domain containing protein [Phaeomoniella chlamydospora]
MAEAIGIVASGVGIAAFIVQIAESAAKIKETHSSIKNAPAEVASALEEVTLLGDLLTDIAASHSQATALGIAAASTWERSFERCRSTLNTLYLLMCKLNESLKNRKRAHVPRTLHAEHIVQTRDLDTLRILFESGKASPFDEDPFGYTPLHIAARNNQFLIVKFLLSHGANPETRNYFGSTPLMFQLLYIIDNHCLKTSQLLITEQTRNGDGLEEDLWSILKFYPSIDLKSIKIVQGYAYKSLLEQDLSWRIQKLSETFDPEVFWILLGKHQLDATYFDSGKLMSHITRVFGCTCVLPFMRHIIRVFGRTYVLLFMRHIIRVFGRTYVLPPNFKHNSRREEWCKILHAAVAVQGHLSTLQLGSNSRSLMTEFLKGYGVCYRVNEVIKTLRQWIMYLNAAGADLVKYGSLEHDLLLQECEAFQLTLYLKEFPRDFRVRIINFTYGPSPDDWNFWISWPLDEWAGEFWNWVENPELFDIPGSWIEDNWTEDE